MQCDILILSTGLFVLFGILTMYLCRQSRFHAYSLHFWYTYTIVINTTAQFKIEFQVTKKVAYFNFDT